MSGTYRWRGDFTDDEYRVLHEDAFGLSDARRAEGRRALIDLRSFGWVTARERDLLTGFVNVVWDGRDHAWIQDLMVDSQSRLRGVATRLVATVRDECSRAGLEWLHVDFEEHLSGFYRESCGFTPSAAGILRLND